jgi:hypothetical protein
VIAVVAAILLCGTICAAAEITSTWNGSFGNWSDATRWSPSSAFPNNGGGNTYNAIVNAATVALDQAITIQNLTLGGGTIYGANQLTLQGAASSWTSGLMGGSGSGTTQIAAGGYMTISGNATNTVSGGQAFTTAGALANSGTVTVGAASSLNVAAAYTQTGGATVVNGALTAGAVNVTGGTIQGAGTITGPLTLGSAGLSPGNSVGTLNVIGDVALGATASDAPAYNWELGADSSDLIAITGGLTVNADTVNLNVIGAGGAPNPATTYVLATSSVRLYVK